MTREFSSFGSRRFRWILRHFDVPEKRGHAAEVASLLAWHGSGKCPVQKTTASPSAPSAVATSAMAIPTNPIRIRTDSALCAFVTHCLHPIVVGVSTYEMGGGSDMLILPGHFPMAPISLAGFPFDSLFRDFKRTIYHHRQVDGRRWLRDR